VGVHQAGAVECQIPYGMHSCTFFIQEIGVNIDASNIVIVFFIA
jgi:hypothetical protein